MELSIRVTQPQLCTEPVQLGIIRCPYQVVTWLLMKLDGYGQQVSASLNIEKTQARAHVPSFQVLSVLTIVRNVLQDFVIHHVDPTFLESIGTSLISSERL